MFVNSNSCNKYESWNSGSALDNGQHGKMFSSRKEEELSDHQCYSDI